MGTTKLSKDRLPQIIKDDVGLSNVDNTSDLNKPISTAIQSSLSIKQDITDNSLTTTNKTIVGAINELRSNATPLPTLFSKEYHVDGVNGLDTNDGSLLKPFKTIGKANSTANNSGVRILIHAGTYVESITFSQQNITIASAHPETGGLCYINGTVNFNAVASSQRMVGIMCNTINHQNAGSLYLTNVNCDNITKSYSALGNQTFLELLNTTVNNTTTITGTGVARILDSSTYNVTMNNVGGGAIIIRARNLSSVNILAGGVEVDGTILVTLTETSNGVTCASSATFSLKNSKVITPTLANGRILMSTGSIYSLMSSTIDPVNSQLLGNNMGNISIFDKGRFITTIQLDGVKNASLLKTDANGNIIAGTISGGGVQLGAIVSALFLSASDGYLELNGQSLSTTTYSDLYNYAVNNGLIDTGTRTSNGRFFRAATNSTTFSLPDLRGGFLRALDNRASGSLDTDRGTTSTVGSYQADQLVSHSHTYDKTTAGPSNVYVPGNSGQGLINFAVNPSTFSTSSASTGGTETRPKNFAVRYYIKATLVVETGITSNTINSQIVSKDWMLGYSLANNIPITTSDTDITALLTTPVVNDNTPPLTLSGGKFAINNTETESYEVLVNIRFKATSNVNGEQTVNFQLLDPVQSSAITGDKYIRFFNTSDIPKMHNITMPLYMTSADIDKLKTNGFKLLATVTEGTGTVTISNFMLMFKRV